MYINLDLMGKRNFCFTIYTKNLGDNAQVMVGRVEIHVKNK